MFIIVKKWFRDRTCDNLNHKNAKQSSHHHEQKRSPDALTHIVDRLEGKDSNLQGALSRFHRPGNSRVRLPISPPPKNRFSAMD